MGSYCVVLLRCIVVYVLFNFENRNFVILKKTDLLNMDLS